MLAWLAKAKRESVILRSPKWWSMSTHDTLLLSDIITIKFPHSFNLMTHVLMIGESLPTI